MECRRCKADMLRTPEQFSPGEWACPECGCVAPPRGPMAVRPQTHDWRADYIVCSHVAADDGELGASRGFRACCAPCLADGFLHGDIRTERRGELVVGTLVESQEAPNG